MKFYTTIFLPLLAAFVGVSHANFDVYASQLFSPTGDVLEGWRVYQNDPSCNDVNNAKSYADLNDVSGNKLGVRCQRAGGGDCNMYTNVNDITLLEMHWNNNPLYHWTLYRDRGHPYKMYGLDGKVYGECIKFPSNNYHCGSFGIAQGHRKFRCLTRFTAHDLQWA